MVYSDKFVLTLRVNDQVQKDRKNGSVVIPFGSEYSLRLRNKNCRRALAKIFIDGENVSDEGYIINAMDYIDIYRHADKDRAFKFVDLDSEEAYDAGKNGPNYDKQKGVIEVRFYLEKEFKKNVKIKRTRRPYTDVEPWLPDYGKISFNSRSLRTPEVYNCSSTSINQLNAVEDGCTVEGDQTGQYFTTGHIVPEDSYVSLRLFVQGYHQNNCPQSHLTQKGNYCENCGAGVVKTAKFCYNCGQKLIVWR